MMTDKLKAVTEDEVISFLTEKEHSLYESAVQNRKAGRDSLANYQIGQVRLYGRAIARLQALNNPLPDNEIALELKIVARYLTEPKDAGLLKIIEWAIVQLNQAPSNQWNFDMSLVPKGEDDMVLLLFNSASVPVVRLCWWNDDEDDGWSIGWYSSKHSVTTEKVADYLGEPIGWCDTPDELYEACN